MSTGACSGCTGAAQACAMIRFTEVAMIGLSPCPPCGQVGGRIIECAESTHQVAVWAALMAISAVSRRGIYPP